ncbi:hypothetical protein QJS04_geneDACA011950 [Acorus gramineus]|uniref:Uncharacterized protein n=1 Tax=Acorus gramineus TaxID=55184 RepID=A0AAV9AIG5_ACOGR|nr:hypothetical protein QJS04_geneDACA011950 [Acorus gramineus]
MSRYASNNVHSRRHRTFTGHRLTKSTVIRGRSISQACLVGRYCSNLYPKVDSYRVCNWCLRDDGGKAVIVQSTTTKTPLSKEGSNSPSSPSSPNTNSTSSGTTSPKLQQRGSIPLSLNKPIKKQRSPDRPPTTTNKKIVVVTGCVEESVRRMRSDEAFNAERPKPVFRGKVRRYKLLEEPTMRTESSLVEADQMKSFPANGG